MSTEPHDTLLALVAQHELPVVLEELAHVMANIGSVTGGVISEVAAIENWLANQRRRP